MEQKFADEQVLELDKLQKEALNLEVVHKKSLGSRYYAKRDKGWVRKKP